MQVAEPKIPILVIIGPSGAGKSTAVRQLVADGTIVINPSWTTRRPRPDEIDQSFEHVFASDSEFDEKDAQGYFLETVQMFGLAFRYGLPPVKPSTSTQVSAVMLRASLVPLIHKHYRKIVVYQIVDDITRVANRLNQRQAEGEPIGTRLRDFTTEIELGNKYAQRTFVNTADSDGLKQQIEQAIAEDFRP